MLELAADSEKGRRDARGPGRGLGLMRLCVSSRQKKVFGSCRNRVGSFDVSMSGGNGRLNEEMRAMRVMLFHKANDGVDMSGPPTKEALEAFAAMDRFTEELVQAGVFVAAAGPKNTR